METKAEHDWSGDDNLVVYCLYRFGDATFGKSRREIGNLLGIPANSISLKIANFKAIDEPGGMDQYSQQALRVHTHYCTLPDDEVQEAGIGALQRASAGVASPTVSVSMDALEARLVIAKQTLAALEELRKQKS